MRMYVIYIDYKQACHIVPFFICFLRLAANLMAVFCLLKTRISVNTPLSFTMTAQSPACVFLRSMVFL